MATESITELRTQGSGDLVVATATLPLRVICRLIGVPDADVAAVRGVGHASSVVFGFPSPEQADAATDTRSRT